MMALVTGGASCGKSALAEELCMRLGEKRVYLAAMRPFGEEGARRVARHRAMRAGKGFTTVECYEGFSCVSDNEALDGATALLECLGNVVANELFADDAAAADDSKAHALLAEIEADVAAISQRTEHLVIVGNEVGCDGFDYPDETRRYQSLLGALSRRLAASSDLVVECSSGIPVVLSRSAEAESAELPVGMAGLERGAGKR